MQRNLTFFLGIFETDTFFYCLSIFPSDVWDKLSVLIWSVPEVSLLIQLECKEI